MLLSNSALVSIKKVYFRVDGNTKIGLGHFVRCIALAQMIRNEFKCIFFMFQPNDEIIKEVDKNDFTLHRLVTDNIGEFTSFLQQKEIVVLDGYSFNSSDQLLIKQKSKLVVIDDLINKHYYADIIINQALEVPIENYSKEKYTKVYFGANYIMLRNAFFNNNKESVLGNLTDNLIFVCMGGADNQRNALKIVKMLQEEGMHCLVLLGSVYDGDLNDFFTYQNVKVFQNLAENEVVDLIDRCNFCIVSASGIAYECASRQKKILLGYYLPHQFSFYQMLCKQKSVFPLGDFSTLEQTNLLHIIKNEVHKMPNQSFVDGNQRSRYLKIFKELSIL